MSEQLCNLMLEETDLKKLQDLDPFQTDGYQSNCKLNIPVKIVYIDETGKQTTDTQIITFQMLTRWVRTVSKNKQAANLDSLKIVITSEDDVFLAFVNNINQSGFQTLKNKNQLNLHFNDFPSTLITMLKNCISSNEFNQINQAELKLSYEGTGKFYIFQNTQYKKIQLIELFFSSCNIEKSHQSIIYRYNYNKTKLRMLQNSIQSVYKLLAQKNVPLLHYIQKHVGMDQ